MRRIDKKLNMMKANILAESRYLESKGLIKEEEYLKGTLHTLIGTEMRAEKLADNTGAKHHVAVYEEAAKATKEFLRQHPEMMDAAEEITNHFSKKLYGLDESDLSTYKGEMSKSGDYPFTRNVGDRQKADELERFNKENRKAFEEMFNKKYSNTIIKTSDGDYTFETLQFRNNHGNYNVVFKKPSNGGFMDSTLIISYDQNNGYYVSDKGYDVNGRKIEVNLDDESAKKVTEMLKYNK